MAPDEHARIAARNRLVEAHMDWARKQAWHWHARFRQVPLADLQQAAYVGLIESAKRYDPETDNDFENFAWSLVRGEIAKCIRDSRLVNLPWWIWRRIQEEPRPNARESFIQPQEAAAITRDLRHIGELSPSIAKPDVPDTPDGSHRHARIEKVRAAVASLPPAQRETVQLLTGLGDVEFAIPMREIAERRGTSLTSPYRSYHTALGNLRAKLSDTLGPSSEPP